MTRKERQAADYLQRIYDSNEVNGCEEKFKKEALNKMSSQVPLVVTEEQYRELMKIFFVEPGLDDDEGFPEDDEVIEGYRAGNSMSQLGLEGWFSEKDLKEALEIDMNAEVIEKIGFYGEIKKDIVRNTAHVLTKLNDPTKWVDNKNGLVYGMVQSGKTNNMLVLTSFAFNSGYDFVIILTSNNLALREQTQGRFSNAFSLTQGVRSFGDMSVYTRTESHETMRLGRANGFDHFHGNRVGSRRGHVKQFIVLNKDTSVLTRYCEALSQLVKGVDENFDYKLKFLLIDDEADHSSLNAAQNEDTLSTINRKITDLYESLGCVDYLAYTATPQGCIAANPMAAIGYPKDFIWVLDPFLPRRNDTIVTGSYIGGYEVFYKLANHLCVTIPESDWPRHQHDEQGGYIGVTDIHDEDLEAITVSLDEAEIDFLKGVKDGLVDEPKSITDALVDFIINGAYFWREWWEKDQSYLLDENIIEHVPYFACLFNPSRRKETQALFHDLVKNMWREATSIVFEKGEIFHIKKMKLMENLRAFKKTSFLDEHYDFFIDIFITEAEKCLCFRDGAGQLNYSEDFIYLLNGDTNFELDYSKTDETAVKKAAITIGGNKLSRGLTIEGLAISYYSRSQRVSLQDTVTQMARWYGHKAHYAHLLRIYLHDSTFKLFRHLSSEDLRLRFSIKESIFEGRSPLDTIIELQQSELYKVTNPVKGRRLVEGRLTGYSRDFATYKSFHEDVERLKINAEHFDKFTEKLSQHIQSKEVWKRGHLWKDASLEEILHFLNDLDASEATANSQHKKLMTYLKAWSVQPEHSEEGVKTNVVAMNFRGKALTERMRKGLPINGTEEDLKALAENEFDTLLGGQGAGGYKGDRFIDMSKEEHNQKSTSELHAIRKQPLLLVYELDPHYIKRKNKFRYTYQTGDERYLELHGRGIISYCMVFPKNRLRGRSLINPAVTQLSQLQ